MFVAIISRTSSTFPSKTPSAPSDHPDDQNNQLDSKRLKVILASILSTIVVCLTLVWIFRVQRKREQAISQNKSGNERKAKPLLSRFLKARLNTRQKVGRGSISPFDVMRPSREPLNGRDSEKSHLPTADTQSVDQATISVETERGRTNDTGRTSVNTVIPNSRRVGNGILFPSQVYERVRASEQKQSWDRVSSKRMNKVKTSRSGLSLQRVGGGEDGIAGLDLGAPMPRNGQNRRQGNIVQHMDSGLRIQAVQQSDSTSTRDVEDVQDEEEMIDLPPVYASV
ncbi:hypothetical protein K435DRAFT_863048 [Dendrothele bispora CBS 962.96]|uniref:Uncharacterized protein n=1 Tax=Dendrothele bispora (strain CBS 962.96) TaxID=1314807 RepID=A0A4V4HEN4_DENBC|nr:hypothetical protein K435DRAFT_863048 [Dendrothele bispora CBS 962.96]